MLCLFGCQGLSKQYRHDDNVRALIKSMHDAFDFASHEDILKSMEPQSKQAEVLTLMLRDACSCSDFIQSCTKDSRFCTLSSPALLANLNVRSSVVWPGMLEHFLGSGMEEIIQELSTTLVDHRRALLDHAVITAERTAFQILNGVGKISSQLEDAGM
jgi:hypothetical protein